jgi:hypothetical protein
MTTSVELRPADYEAIRSLLYDWTGIRLQNKEQLVIGRLAPRLRQLVWGAFESTSSWCAAKGAARKKRKRSSTN